MSPGVIARATKAVTAHVKELKGKSSSNSGSSGSNNNCNGSSSCKPEYGPIKSRDNIPSDMIHNFNTNTTYKRGKLLGKGGFAQCYELIDCNTNIVYAGKIIPHSRIAKGNQKQKILREIELHRNLKHKHVVEFHSYFEDSDNVYIILENCSRKSLVHVLKNRKCLQEQEVRYYVRQLIEGVKYIHKNKIIHRDLKLGNMFLNKDMQVKIGDFGLATTVNHEGEKKMTVCGTPNYIAPEVLSKKGHSYEADIWAIGCILYALLVGRPPFQTSTLVETYFRITANTYTIPANISPAAEKLISRCLHALPSMRPSLDEIAADEFFTSGYIPKSLPPTVCSSAPKFPDHPKPARPMSYADLENQVDNVKVITNTLHNMKADWEVTAQKQEHKPAIRETVCDNLVPTSSNNRHFDLSSFSLNATVLLEVLESCIESPIKETISEDHISSIHLNSQDVVWVTKWVDYTNKYGFGFQLSDNSIGVFFNDTSRIVIAPDQRLIQYNDVTGKESRYPIDCVPPKLEKKKKLLLLFARYMDEYLIKGGEFTDYSVLTDSPMAGLYLKKWFRTPRAILMYLSNGTLQVNVLSDHTKIIISCNQNNYFVTYIDKRRLAHTYSVVSIMKNSCQPELKERLQFTHNMLEHLINSEGESI
ncbi:serine/threonine-protein kinase PLK1 [Octopus bimaculoides]|uniref:serine/threonine-protein kinase PLK1 n=1 Tax=Octopus bimaculoides TaxID=37653 RepID=UPI00071CAA0E|nr:serine/threonine-protein kinase PLK1 [Octopus bimaculoides]|eukprot:XP_014777232.1 PREDICTED: serine/threonine-protein kinase PLK1-like [Octopus bimaculoides]